MDLQKLVPIISDLRDEKDAVKIKTLQSREEESQIDLDSKLAQVVIGVRRSGKSTMCLKSLRENNKNFAYINFDDERLEGAQTEDLNNILEALYVVYGQFDYLFLDEVQNVKGWPLFVNRLLRQGLHIIITGSNAKLLSNELMTHLTGRHNEIDLFPFSFSEYVEYLGLDTHSQSTRATALLNGALVDYLNQGGFPELIHEKNKRNYISALTDSIIGRDIAKRFKIRNVPALKNVANYLMDNFSQEFVAKAVGAKFGISDHTAERYYGFLKEAFLLQGIKKFSYKSCERNRCEKVYVVDLAFVSDRGNTFSPENLGWRLENAVFLELMRRAKASWENIFYYRDKSFEVDFLRCSAHSVEELVQVCYDISNEKTLKREINGLIKGSRKFNCKKLTLITLNKKGTKTAEGLNIEIIPATEWLLQRGR